MVPLSQAPETQTQDKMDENGTDRIKRFLTAYRPLECSCCNSVVAFQHRVTGKLFCAFKPDLNLLSSCYSMQGSEMTQALGKPMMIGVHDTIQPQHLAVTNASAAATAAAVASGQKSYENVVPKLVAPPHRASVDAVDGGHSMAMPVEKIAQSAAPQPPKSASVPASTAKQETFTAPVTSAKPRYLWSDCKYSSKLTNKALVIVSFVWDATNVLVNAAADETGMGNLQAKLMEYASKAKPMSTAPVVGEMVIAPYGEEYYRGRVTQIAGSLCQVVFVDYGDQINCDYSKVLPVDEKIMTYPIYGLTVHLESLPSDPKGAVLPKELVDVIESNTFQLEICQQGALFPSENVVEAKLLDCDGGLSLNQTIRNDLFSTFVAAQPEPKKRTPSKPAVPLWSDCHYSPNFTSGAVVFIQFQYTHYLYHLGTEVDAADLEKFQGVLAEFAEKAKPLNAPPVRDQIVIGKYDEQFYRARVDKIESDDSCRVVFVDYGDRRSFKFSDLLQVDDSIMKHPIYGMVASLDGVPKSPTGAQLKFSADLEATLNEMMTLEVCSKDQLVPEKAHMVTVRLYSADRNFCVNEGMLKAVMDAPK